MLPDLWWYIMMHSFKNIEPYWSIDTLSGHGEMYTERVAMYLCRGGHNLSASPRKGNSDYVCAARQLQASAHTLTQTCNCLCCLQAGSFAQNGGRLTYATQVARLKLLLSDFQTAITSSMEKIFTYRDGFWRQSDWRWPAVCGFRLKWEAKRLIWVKWKCISSAHLGFLCINLYPLQI